MSRYREIAAAEMNPAQKRVHDQIVAGKRGRFGGPFQLLIRAPGDLRARVAARRASALGHLAARPAVGAGDHHDGAVLARAVRMVCACAARRGSRACRRPRSRRSAPAARRCSTRQGRGACLPRSATRSSARSGCPTRASARRSRAFGEQGVVEIISIIGYYTLIGNTLNVFQVALPEGETPPFSGIGPPRPNGRVAMRFPVS